MGSLLTAVVVILVFVLFGCLYGSLLYALLRRARVPPTGRSVDGVVLANVSVSLMSATEATLAATNPVVSGRRGALG
jgi:hypothetical protein